MKIPLRFIFVFAVVMTVLITGLGVGIPAYRDSVKATNLLWENLSKRIADLTTEKTRNYFKTGPHFLEFTENLIRIGELDLSQEFDLLTYSAEALKAHPHFYWVYYSRVDGSVTAALHQKDHSIEAHLRKILPHPSDPKHSTFTRNYLFENNQWALTDTLWESYDPRNRPYWEVGLTHPSGGWTKPYLFVEPNTGFGITYVLPYYVEGKLQGMWAVDYFLDEISYYLSSLPIGKEGLVAIVTDCGIVVASSTKEGSMRSKTGAPLILGQDNNQDTLSLAWNYLKKDLSKPFEHHSKRFEIGSYLGYIQPFPDLDIPWNVLTIVPKSMFFKSIDHQMYIAIALATCICLICAIGVSLFLSSISKELKEIATDMERVGELKLSEPGPIKKQSLIREINLMQGALARMKSGLRSFAKYVPIDLVSKLMQSGHPAEIGGEKQQITVLFSDLTNFTALAETETSEELVRVLKDYLSEMSDLIKAQNGTVDKYIGDGIMAFWGAPTPTTSHAVDACRAALIMSARANTLWKDFKNTHHGVELSLRIGINTGEAIVGNFGSEERMNYTAVGDTVNLASRLEHLNKVYGTQILLGPKTAAQVEPFFLLRPIDSVTVKGKKQAVLIYELLSEK